MELKLETKKKAERLHKQRAYKARTKRLWLATGNDFIVNNTSLFGIRTTTKKNCSCWMCGNARKYFKSKSLKEISDLEFFKQND